MKTNLIKCIACGEIAAMQYPPEVAPCPACGNVAAVEPGPDIATREYRLPSAHLAAAGERVIQEQIEELSQRGATDEALWRLHAALKAAFENPSDDDATNVLIVVDHRYVRWLVAGTLGEIRYDGAE